jgi:c-di-GMP-binding flagellar brake protein YcgR
MNTISQKLKIDKFALFLFYFATTAFSENLFTQIGWKGADSGIISGLVLVFISGFSVFLVMYFRSKSKMKNMEVEQSTILFNENVRKVELSPIEVSRLQDLLKHETTHFLHVIFQSAPLFEKVIDEEVRLIQQKNLTNEEMITEEVVLSNLRKKLGFSYLPHEHPLISTRNIEMGQSVSIFDKKNDMLLIQNARVVLNKEFYFRVQYNPDNEESLQFFENQPLLLAFARQGDAVYGIPVAVFKTDFNGMIDLFHTMEMKRNQLRHHVRIEVNVSVKIRLVKPAKEENQSARGTVFEGRMSDVSGGGCCFVLERPFVPGDIVSLTYQLTTGAFAGIPAKVLRVSLLDGNNIIRYRHSLQFVNLEHKAQEKIIKFVFEKQRQINQWR